MFRKITLVVFIFLVICGIGLVSSERAFAGFGFSFFGNGNFETGDFTDWEYTGSVWMDSTGNSPNNVIDGTYSAYLDNDPAYTVGSCSFLWSGFAFPTNIPKAVNVNFKVRYKTDESPYGLQIYDDPFHAMVKTAHGSVNAVTIGSSGLTQGPGFTVKNTATNTVLAAPTMPPFHAGVIYENETPTLWVSGSVAVKDCNPVYIMFDICQSVDLDVDSAAWVDDVNISFTPATLSAPQPCPSIEP